jgi:uncharacterized membrane protein
MQNIHQRAICGITKVMLPVEDLVAAEAIRQPVYDLIKKSLPAWSGEGYIARNELNKYRHLYVQNLLIEEKGQLTTLEKEVLATMDSHSVFTHNVESEIDQSLTLGERLADKVATFGGSWTFIISFLVFMAIWMTINIYVLASRAFDPFPFILLNLVLSCIAALQAPVIMMSQNRQEDKDRSRSENDYQVNLKAELEIQQLHQKLDHLIQRQGQRQLEIQELQVEMLNHIMERLDEPNKKKNIGVTEE